MIQYGRILFLCAASLITFAFSKAEPYLEKGIASFYAKKFDGRRTTSGEIFRNDSLTCAHKTLKFGTVLKITNLSNDSIVLVRVNDRLPKSSKRIVDLSQSAAVQLNFIRKGLTKVTMEIIEPIVVSVLLEK